MRVKFTFENEQDVVICLDMGIVLKGLMSDLKMLKYFCMIYDGDVFEGFAKLRDDYGCIAMEIVNR